MQPARTKRARTIMAAKSFMRIVLANKAARMPAAIAGLAVTAFLIGALLPTGQKAARSGPADSNLKAAAKPNQSEQTRKAQPGVSSRTGRRSIGFYTGDVRASMFSEPVAPAPPSAPPAMKMKPVPPAPVDPFADWNYTGTATIGDDKVAILENINTHDGVLLHIGDKFLGTKVSEINGNLLTFGAGSKSKSLFVSMNTSYIPLSNSASFLTAKPEQPTNANNVQALLASMLSGNKVNAAAAGGPSVTLPNGRVLTGNQLTRYNQRLNRGWNTTAPAPAGR